MVKTNQDIIREQFIKIDGSVSQASDEDQKIT